MRAWCGPHSDPAVIRSFVRKRRTSASSVEPQDARTTIQTQATRRLANAAAPMASNIRLAGSGTAVHETLSI